MTYIMDVDLEEIRTKIRTELERKKNIIEKNSLSEVFTGSVNVNAVMSKIREKLAEEGEYPAVDNPEMGFSVQQTVPYQVYSGEQPETTFFKLARRLKKYENRPVFRSIWPILKAIKDSLPENMKFVQGIPLQELLNYQDEEFIIKAYDVLLQRGPDAWGMQNYLQALRSANIHKVEILGILRYSTEGKAKKVFVVGLRSRYLFHRITGVLSRLPVIGYLFQWITTLLLLPRLVRHLRAGIAVHDYRLARLDSDRSSYVKPSRELAELREQLSQVSRTMEAQKRRMVVLEEYLERKQKDEGVLATYGKRGTNENSVVQ